MHTVTFVVGQRTYRLLREIVSYSDQPSEILDYWHLVSMSPPTFPGLARPEFGQTSCGRSSSAGDA